MEQIFLVTTKIEYGEQDKKNKKKIKKKCLLPLKM
jgi:hypothetical protein